VVFYNKFNQFCHWGWGGGELSNFLMGKIEKQTLIREAFMEKLTQIHQIPKIPNHHFSEKFQWVTK